LLHISREIANTKAVRSW